MPDQARIAVLRRVDGLFELTVGIKKGDPLHECREALSPLSRSSTTAKLLDAWGRLGAAREITPALTDDVLQVLARTAVDPDGDRPSALPLSIELPPPPHKPTAANPRAYKGTKDRPPKPRRPEPVDLRPILCTAGGPERVLEKLGADHGAVRGEGESRREPNGFRRYFAWVLRLVSSEDRGRLLAAYHQLGLEEDAGLRRSIAFLTAKSSHAAAWCELLASIHPDRRVQMLDVLWSVDATRDPSPAIDDLRRLDALSTDALFGRRMLYALTWWLEDDLPDVVEMFRWFDELGSEHTPDLDDPPPGPADLRELRAFVERFPGPSDWIIDRLVWGSSESDEFVAAVGRLTRASLSSVHAHELVRTLAAIEDQSDSEITWPVVLRKLDEFLAAFAALPASHQDKGLELLSEFAWEGNADEIGFATTLLGRICVPPFPAGSHIHLSLEGLARVDGAYQDAVLAAPDSSFATLDDRSRRKNEAFLIAVGIITIGKEDPQLLVDAFTSAPAALCRAARALGLFHRAAARGWVRAVRRSPLRSGELPSDAGVLVRLVDEHAGKVAMARVPARLRQFVDGEFELRPGQVDRHVAKLQSAWPAVCCDAILRHARRQIGQDLVGLTDGDFETLSEQMSHALMLQAHISDQSTGRRSLRRLIRAWHEGNTTFLDDHPRNRAWLAAHPKVPADRWLEGLSITRDVGGIGQVTIAIERDPLEALRLGTYVGSCLGVGGSFAWSAAATVLDINKQVVFARTAAGGFLARQILGITNGDELACCDIYPKVSPGLQALFRDFDGRFAEMLELPIQSDAEENEENEKDEKHDKDRRGSASGDEDHLIADVLADDWYHDGNWDFKIEE